MMALPLVHSTGAILISSKYIKKLPPDLRELLISGLTKTMKELTLDLRRQNMEAVKMIQDSGLTIIPVPKGEALDEFYGIHDQVAKELTGKIYPKGVLERVYKILKKHQN